MSMDFPNFEKMKRECPRAAIFWRMGDSLYYVGLLSIVFSIAPFFAFRTKGLLFVAVGGVLAFVLGVFLKGKSYELAKRAGCSFD